MEQKCANCGNGKWRDGVTPFTETCCKCHYVDKGALGPQPSNWIPKTQTNADRIRAMSDDELAHFLAERSVNESTVQLLDKDNDLTAVQIEALRHRIYCALMQWLKQPVEE